MVGVHGAQISIAGDNLLIVLLKTLCCIPSYKAVFVSQVCLNSMDMTLLIVYNSVNMLTHRVEMTEN